MKVLQRRSQHTRWNGVPKRKYLDAESADAAAQRMREVTEQMFDKYVCGECDHWHVGHTKQQTPTSHIELCIELGERVLAHMKAENQGSKPKKIAVLRKRAHSAWRVAYRIMSAA